MPEGTTSMRSASRTVLRCTMALAALAALAAVPRAANAQAPSPTTSEDPKRTDEARARFQRGVELYRDGDYRAAIIEFRRAYDLVPNWRIQYNLAQACAEVQDYPCALRALQAYVADGGAEIPSDRRAQVETELKRLTGRIARVTVKVNRPDAELFTDEVSVGKTPLQGAALVSAGRRRISATLPSGQTISKMVEVAGGDEITVNLDFEEAPRPRPSDAAATKPPTEAPSAAPLYVGLVATGLLAAGTATTGLLALSADRDLTRELDRIPGDGRAIDDARSKTETLGMVTNVLGVATIVAGGVTLYLALTRPTTAKVGVTTLPGGALLSGRF